MNLGQMLRRVETELQYEPDLLAHRQDFREVINEVYQALARERSWPWLWRQEPLWVLPDIEFPFADTEVGGITVTPVDLVTGQPRRFEIDKQYVCSVLGIDTGAWTIELQSRLLAAEFDLIEPLKRSEGDGTWERAPFVVEAIGAVAPDSSNDGTVTLDPRCDIDSLNGSEGEGVVIRPRRIRLPAGLDELDALLDANGVPLAFASPRTARNLLDPNRPAGSPMVALEDGGMIAGEGVNQFETEFAREIENWPVRERFTLTDGDPSSGDLTPGVTVRVFLSWSYAGRLGPPSEIVELVVPDSGVVKVTGIPVLPETTGVVEYGRHISVWMAEGEGAFFYQGLHTTPATATFEIDTPNSAATTVYRWTRRPRWDEQYTGSTYKYVRLYPHPSALTQLTCQFWARARQLIEDTDSPEFHEAYHDLIVWLACKQLATRYGSDGDVQRFMAHIKERRSALDARYFYPKKYNGTQRGMIGGARRTRPDDPVDWHGDQ